MPTLLPAQKTSQQGIALVVVLGLLAMLLILSVSFVISMRVERIAGHDVAESAKAKNVALTALARAMAQMEDEMYQINRAGPNPTQSNAFYHGNGTVSEPSGAGEGCNLRGTLVWWYPYSSMPLNPVYNIQRWTDIKDPAGNLMGQYGFLAVDISSYLDVNTIGNLPRGAGTNSGEVSLPVEVDNSAGFIQERRLHRVESGLEALFRLFRIYCSGSNNYSMVSFSHFPNDKYISTGLGVLPYAVSNRFNIGSPGVQNLVMRNTMIQKIRAEIPGNSSFAHIEAAFVTNLWDYVTPGLVPQNPRSFGTKPVPMINEIVVSNLYALGRIPAPNNRIRYTYTNTYNVGVEVWYPFFNTNAQPFTVWVSAQYTGTPGFPPPVINANTTISGPWVRDTYRAVRLPATAPPGWAAPAGVWTQPLPGVPPTTPPPAGPAIAGGTVRLYVTVRSGGSILDLTTNITINIGSRFVGRPTLAAPVKIAAWGKAADDPRINWDGASLSQWANELTPASLSFGRRNPRVSAGQPGKDPDTGMYCRRGPLQTIGELGFLLYNANRPWQTVRLLRLSPTDTDPDYTARLFDLFTLAPTNQVFQGLVNPNTQYRVFGINCWAPFRVLSYVFVDTPRERYPGEPSSAPGFLPPLPRPQADNLANQVRALVINSGPCTNISDICRLAVANIPGGGDFWQKKAVMRNSLGLLSPRQNLWVIGVAGRAVKDVNNDQMYREADGDFVTAVDRATFLVWRDPYEDPTDTVHQPGQRRHRCFIQYVHWE